MEQLPKIVAQRLQAVSRTEAHPDANLLAAFAEKSLLPREQAQILEHLAGCSECREVVAHAQPEEVLHQVAATAPMTARRSWFSGVTVRWAALAACVVVVGAVVISRTQFAQLPKRIATNIDKPAVVAKTETQPAPSSSPAEESNKKQSENDVARLKATTSIGTKRDEDELSKLREQQPARAPNSLAGARQQKETPTLNLEANSAAPSAADSVSATAAAAPVAVAQSAEKQKAEDAKASKREFSADKAMRIPATSETVEVQASPIESPAPPKNEPIVADGQRGQAAAASIGAFSREKDGYVGPGAVGGILATSHSIIPRWQLSPNGKLIKSNDLGKTWQTVPVADKVVFRALCVTGREVWVGGNQGNLFYSSDAGQQWEQVKPAANGQTLTTDIAAIEFKDPQHGKITTVNHQTWITSDGGHAWQVESR